MPSTMDLHDEIMDDVMHENINSSSELVCKEVDAIKENTDPSSRAICDNTNGSKRYSQEDLVCLRSFNPDSDEGKKLIGKICTQVGHSRSFTTNLTLTLITRSNTILGTRTFQQISISWRRLADQRTSQSQYQRFIASRR